MSIAENPPRIVHSFAGMTLDRFQAVIVWLMFASTFVALIEPAPSDVLFIFVVLSFLKSGLKITTVIAPLILMLLLYNIGGMMSYMQIFENSKAGIFVITTFYMSVSAVFLAFYISENTLERLDLIKNAIIIAAVIASLIAIAGYFNIGGFVGGSERFASKFARYNRAVGLFKDPNVFSTYIIFPALLLIQGFMLGTQKRKFISAISLFIILIALFLAFSRGAWISFVFASVLLVAFTFILTPSIAMRSRIVVFFVAGAILCVVIIAMLLSVEQIRNLFLDRFTLVKSYDSGETGRFGNQLNAIPMLLQRPLGFGPLEFGKMFTYDPHNVYLNAFSAYGWLGGLVYPVLIITTLIVGFKTIIIRTPWQNYAIVIFCPLVSTILQGVQIDTDHWRHFYWLLGLIWGLFAASLDYPMRNQIQSQNSGSRLPLHRSSAV